MAVANVQQANAPHEPQPIIKVHNNNSIADDYTNRHDDDDNDDDDSVASINVNPDRFANAVAPNVTDKLDNNEVSGVRRSKRKNKGATNRSRSTKC